VRRACDLGALDWARAITGQNLVVDGDLVEK
jgi:hypothetical protein